MLETATLPVDSVHGSSSRPKLRLLSREEEFRLAERYAAGDDRARAALIEHNIPLVKSIAKQYVGRGVSLEDLVQEGTIGLIRSVDRFDYTKGYRLSTYATHWIVKFISDAIPDLGLPIRLPRHVAEQQNKVRRAATRLAERGIPVTNELLASETDLSLEEIAKISATPRVSLSLDTPIGENQDAHLTDVLQSLTSEDPLARALQNSDHEILSAMLKTLPDREARIITLHYGLEGAEVITLAAVGLRLSLTTERVRQLHHRALKKLRHTMDESSF